MTTKQDGGPAFPCEREHGEKLESAEGMSLRDYFAAKAMPVLMDAFQFEQLGRAELIAAMDAATKTTIAQGHTATVVRDIERMAA